MSTWHVALAYALTGERIPLTPVEIPDQELLLAELAELGWSGTRLAEAARTARQVPSDLMAGIGAAQFWALIAQLRSVIGADGQIWTAPTRRTRLNAEEQRLAADRPPHW